MSDIPQFWRSRNFVSLLFMPLATLFATACCIRRVLYRFGVLKTWRAPVPVIIIGNLTIGGSGKTPLVQALVSELRKRGVTTGIISRGYGGSAKMATDVATCPDATVVGDEPLFLWQMTGAPVVVCKKRIAAAQKLLQDYPETQLLIADDGLQHYALVRDVEIVVIAADLGLGNGFPLPAGPLRETSSRLCCANIVLSSDPARYPHPHSYPLHYTSDGVRPLDGGEWRPLTALAAPLYALTAIARPERFFANLRAQGANLAACCSLPDHAALPAAAADFAVKGSLIISGKDAVKTAAWPEELKKRTYVTDYRAELPPELLPLLFHYLGLAYSRPIAKVS
jgi:tetraacyldisaccharide 4'-kinase